MALKTVFEYCFNAIEFYPKSNRFVLASRRKSNHFVLKIRLGGFADYTSSISMDVCAKIFIGSNNISTPPNHRRHK